MAIGQIGIVAVSPEGAQLFYTRLMRLAARRFVDGQGPTVCMHGLPLKQYLDATRREDWLGVAHLLTESARKLVAAGADFVLTPDHVVQHAIHLAEEQSPVSWLRMTDMVAQKAEEMGVGTVGVIGMREAMFGAVYQTVLGLRGVKVQAPTEDEAQTLHDILFTELIFGISTPESEHKLVDIVKGFADRGAEAMIIASSEIPLVLTAANSPLPIIDAAELLAVGALDRAVSATGG